MKVLLSLIMGISFLFGAVDINSADAKELSTLNGIGMKKAEAIISYRKMNCFKSVHELSLVKGIGNKTIEKNKANLTASKCKK